MTREEAKEILTNRYHCRKPGESTRQELEYAIWLNQCKYDFYNRCNTLGFNLDEYWMLISVANEMLKELDA